MGFLSSTFKGVKKGVKRISRGIGTAFKKVFREVKRFAKSDLGKFAIAAAVIYFGGAALANVSAPAVSTTPALVAPTTTGAATTALATTAPSTVAPAVLETGGAVQGGISTGAALESGAGAGISVGGTTPAVPSFMEQAGSVIGKRPGLAMLGAGQIISALTAPEPIDPLDAEKYRRRTSNIAGVGYKGQGTPLGGPQSRAGNVRQALREDLYSTTRR